MPIEELLLGSGLTMIDFIWLIILLVELMIVVVLWVILEKIVRWALKNTEYRITLHKKKRQKNGK